MADTSSALNKLLDTAQEGFGKRKIAKPGEPTMKEAIVRTGPVVEIVDSPIPTPGPDQLVIQVVVSGSNPKDW
jgi:hypothetical protein